MISRSVPRSVVQFLPGWRPPALLGAVALLVTQFPIVNVLGLEFAAAMAPVVAYVAGWSIVRSELPVRPRTWVQAAVRSVLLSVPPLVVGLLAALFVRNCALLDGLVDFLWIVPPAAFVGLGLGVLARGLTLRWPRTLFTFLWFAVLSQIVIATFFGPQIYAFNLIVGYFPGFSYDDTLGLPGSLELFRLASLWFAVTAVLTGVQLERARREHRLVWRRWLTGLTAASWVLLAVCWVQSDRFGWSSSLEQIERELGGRRDGERLTMMYPSDVVTEDQADRLLAFHEFTYERLRRTLRVSPSQKVVCFVYRDAAQKNRLTGGGRTNFTKPWLRQVHLLRSDVRETLRHEMVHVLAADFGYPVLGIGVNAGVVEGLAVALDRSSNGESIHRAAAQIFSTGYAGSVEQLFTLTGFFRSNSAVSYTLAGSFSRYLIERFGVRNYKTFYRTGDSRQAFFHELSDLTTGWRRRISEIPLTAADSAKAVLIYRRPPIYARECLRVIGDLHTSARAAFSEGRDADGLRYAERSWSLTRSPEAAMLYAQGLLRTGQRSELLRFVDSLRADPERWPFVRMLDVAAGDALWGMDSLVAAADAYERVRDMRLSLGWTETTAFRWEALTRWGWDRPLVAAVIGQDPDSIRRRIFEAAALAGRGRPHSALLRYAAARLISSEQEPDAVIRLLSGTAPLGHNMLNYVARRKLASAYVANGSWERAKAMLWESLNYTDNEAELLNVNDTIAYVEWLKARLPKR